MPSSQSRYSVQRQSLNIRKTIPLGTSFGRLTVIETGFVIRYRGQMGSACKVRCSCGTEKTLPNTLLKDFNVGSCGCEEHRFKKKIDSEWRQVLAFIRHSASYKRRGKSIPFLLTLEHIKAICKLPCAYCKLEPSIKLYSQAWVKGEDGIRKRIYTDEVRLLWSGIDRVNSTLGYEPGNCVPCCKFCNYAKQDSSLAEFIERIARFGSHLEAREVLALAESLTLAPASKLPTLVQ